MIEQINKGDLQIFIYVLQLCLVNFSVYMNFFGNFVEMQILIKQVWV